MRKRTCSVAVALGAVTWIVAGSLGLCAKSPLSPHGSLVVNEVLFFHDLADEHDHQWVELYNGGTEAVDLAGFVLTGRAAEPLAVLPDVLMPPDAFLVVRFAEGVDELDFGDGQGTYYTQRSTDAPPAFYYLEDEVALFSGLISASRLVDFVSWKGHAGDYTPGAAHGLAVAAEKWPEGAYFDARNQATIPSPRGRSVREGESIGRDKDATDADVPADWDVTGGPDALDITPLQRNLSAVATIVERSPGAEGTKDWTFMLYLDGDNDLEEEAWWTLNALEWVGGSDDHVNVVVLVDFSAEYIDVSVSRDGGVVSTPTSGAWRGSLGADQDMDLVRLYAAPGDDAELGEINMGSAETLGGFAQWAASNYPARRYALVMWDHGGGWKGTTFDDAPDDALFMAELRAGLAACPVHLDLLGFDQCMMAMIEVANQVAGSASVLVASEDSIYGWPIDRVIAGLKANPGWSGSQFGTYIVTAHHEEYTTAYPDPLHTISAISLGDGLAELTQVVDRFASDLAQAVEDVREHVDPSDNVQLAIAAARAGVEAFFYEDYIDLAHFAERVRDEPGIPMAYKSQAATIADLLRPGAGVILAEAHGPEHPNAQGLSIYFPESQADELFGCTFWYDDPWPSKYPSMSSGDRQYAADPDDCTPTDPEAHPFPATPDFLFPETTSWDEFLHRYYEPVADAGADQTALVGEVVVLDGGGSSDADGWVLQFLWDVVPGTGTDDGDWDRDCVDETDDDNNWEGMRAVLTFEEPGTYPVVLTVWDDHDQRPGHEGHFETDSDTAIITVLPLGYDYGDAPDPPYPTLSAPSIRPFHGIRPGFHLGAGVDADPDGQPDALALGDDERDEGDDDDGVSFDTPVMQGHTVTITVTASAAGYLDAWIDLDANGSWDGEGEQIFTSEPLQEGASTLTFRIGYCGTPGPTYARFRFSSSGGLDPTGEAADGEVEDYLVEIEPDPIVSCIELLGRGSRDEYRSDGTYRDVFSYYIGRRVQFLWDEVNIYRGSHLVSSRYRSCGRTLHAFLSEAAEEAIAELAELFWRYFTATAAS